MNDMKMAELREYARSFGIQPQQHETRESLLFRIAQAAYPELVATEEPKPVQQAVVYTHEEQVRDAIAHFIKQGLEAKFYEDNTWHFRFRGAEDSGTMTMPISAIIRRAESVGKGAFIPRILRGTGSELDGAMG